MYRRGTVIGEVVSVGELLVVIGTISGLVSSVLGSKKMKMIDKNPTKIPLKYPAQQNSGTTIFIITASATGIHGPNCARSDTGIKPKQFSQLLYSGTIMNPRSTLRLQRVPVNEKRLLKLN